MAPTPMADLWMSPCGAGTTDYTAFEKMLDGVLKVGEEEHREEYWGKGTAAHFWGAQEKPVRRVIANVVKIDRGQDWKTATIDAKKDDDVRTLYRKKMTEDHWPKGPPMAVDSNRILGSITAPPKQQMVVAGSVSLKGLYIAPLTSKQREDVRKAVHDDFLSATGFNTVVTNLRSTETGTRVVFHVDASKAESKTVLDKVKRSLPSTKTNMLNNLYLNFKLRPSGATVESNKCQVVLRKKMWVRGDPVSGAASDDFDLGSKMASSGLARAPPSSSTPSRTSAGYSSSSRPTTASPSASRTTASSSTPTRPTVAGTAKRMPGSEVKRPVTSSAPDPDKAATPAERKKALLGKVMHKTKVQLTKIESEQPYVPASHELAQRKEAIAHANIKLAQKQGISDAAKEQAKLNLKPPSTWLGALVRVENGRKVFENFELHIVDFVKETMSLVGRARVQNGKMDMTYQAKTRVLAKDNEMVVEIVLDSSGVIRGGFDKPGQISGTFKFPNGTGTFKLMRAHNDED